jgi:hypothetical protein
MDFIDIIDSEFQRELHIFFFEMGDKHLDFCMHPEMHMAT